MSEEEDSIVWTPTSIFSADQPAVATVHEAAQLSGAIYKLREQPTVAGYTMYYHHQESPDDYRVANWCIFISEGGTEVYVVFRGSQTVMDWLQNFSFSPGRHSNYPNVRIHSGYYHEVDMEYATFKEKLNDVFGVFDKTKITKVVLTGHSKGGGLAQMLTDKIFNDTAFHAAYPEVCRALTCVTFSAPMIFWFPNPEALSEVQSGFLFHNYIIRKDPVPVLQMVIAENNKSLNRMIESEVGKHTIFAGIAVTALSINEFINALKPFIKGFLPVGAIYVANITKLGDTYGVQFDAAQYDINDLKEWICVREMYFGFDYHGIVNHIGVAKNCLDEETNAPSVCDKKRNYGLYVQNDTHTDVLFVMSYMMTAVYWARVPHHKTVHIGKTKWFYHVRVCRYEERYVPTQAGQVGQLGVSMSVVAPVVAIGSSIASTGKDNISNTWCDGRTALITKVMKDGRETKHFKIELQGN